MAEMSKKASVFLLGSCSSLVTIDLTAVNALVPSILKDMRVDILAVSWVVNASSLAMALVIILLGYIGQVYGFRRVLALGLVALIIGEIGGFLSPTLVVLIAARIVAGLGSGALLVAALALLTQLVEPEERAGAIGNFNLIAGLAALATPVGIALILSLLDWRVTLLAIAVLAVGCAAFLWRLGGPSDHRETAGLSSGAIVRSICFGAVCAISIFLLTASSEEAISGFSSNVYSIMLVAIVAMASVAYAAGSLSTSSKMSGATQGRMTWLLFLAAVMGMVFGASLFVLPIVTARLGGGAGAIVLFPLAVGAIVGAIMFKRLAQRIVVTELVFRGLGLSIGAIFVTGCLGHGTYLLVGLTAALAGGGYGLSSPALATLVMHGCEGAGGLRSAWFNSARAIGSAVGVLFSSIGVSIAQPAGGFDVSSARFAIFLMVSLTLLLPLLFARFAHDWRVDDAVADVT